MQTFNCTRFFRLRAKSRYLFLLTICLLGSPLLYGQSINGSTCISISSPAAGVTYTYNDPTNGRFQLDNWEVAGDLEIVSTSGDEITVKSATNRSKPPKPYGKGRITAHYTDTLNPECPHSASLDVYKEFDDEYPIIGPECVNESDTVTYSIESIVSVNLNEEIGIDQYEWKFPSHWSLQYYSSDSSSITLKVDSASGQDTLIVGIGQCNFTNGVYTDTLVVGIGAEEPELDYPACVAADEDTITVENLNHADDVDYEWQYPTTWRPVNANPSDSIIHLLPDKNPGTVTLIAETECDSVVAEAEINRSLAAGDSISGPTCVEANSTHWYVINDGPVNTPLNWEIPSGNGWSFVSSNTQGHAVQIQVGTTGDTIKVEGKECPAQDTFLVVDVKPGDPSNLTGDTCLAAGSTDSVTYSIQAANYADQYKWSFPSGWSANPQTTTSTSVTVQPDGSTSGEVKVFALGCENSDTLSMDVNYGGIQPDSILVSSCINFNVDDTVTFEVETPISGQSYDWNVPGSWSIIGSSANNTSIDVETDGEYGTSYTVEARGENACGTSPYYSQDFAIDSVEAVLDSNIIFGAIQYAVLDDFQSNGGSQLPAGTTYQWFFDDVPEDGETSFSTLLDSSTTNPNELSVNVSLQGENCVSRLETNTLYDYSARMTGTDSKTKSDAQAVSIVPNPAQNTFRIEINEDFEQASMKMKSLNGKQIKTVKDLSNRQKLSVHGVSGGMYLLKIMVDDNVYIKKLQVQK